MSTPVPLVLEVGLAELIKLYLEKVDILTNTERQVICRGLKLLCCSCILLPTSTTKLLHEELKNFNPDEPVERIKL